jgi:hypothetical protein
VIQKNPTAAEMGQVGGKAKVKKGMAMLTPKRRREIALAGVAARRRKREARAREC